MKSHRAALHANPRKIVYRAAAIDRTEQNMARIGRSFMFAAAVLVAGNAVSLGISHTGHRRANIVVRYGYDSPMPVLTPDATPQLRSWPTPQLTPTSAPRANGTMSIENGGW
jgi:hypothetical protein